VIVSKKIRTFFEMAAGRIFGVVLCLAAGILVVSAQERKNYAELNAPFILKSLEKLRVPVKTQTVWDTKRNELSSDIPEGKGLYMLYYDTGKRQYPFFVASTEGTFRRALADQYNKEGGAIRTILEGKFPNPAINFPLSGLKAKLVELPKDTQSKLFERAYLDTFYFALNDQETRPTRYELDTRNELVKPTEAKNIFNIQLKGIMTELENTYRDFEG